VPAPWLGNGRSGLDPDKDVTILPIGPWTEKHVQRLEFQVQRFNFEH
jgi:hypothetical protein